MVFGLSGCGGWVGFGGWWVGLVPGLGGCGCAGWLAGGLVGRLASGWVSGALCGQVLVGLGGCGSVCGFV